MLAFLEKNVNKERLLITKRNNMKFKELYIKGSKESLDLFVNKIVEYAKNGWMYRTDTFMNWTYHFFRKEEYGVEVSILYKEKDGCYYVPNIVPLQKSQITREEYNDFLIKFKNEVVDPCVAEKFQNNEITLEVVG